MRLYCIKETLSTHFLSSVVFTRSTTADKKYGQRMVKAPLVANR